MRIESAIFRSPADSDKNTDISTFQGRGTFCVSCNIAIKLNVMSVRASGISANLVIKYYVTTELTRYASVCIEEAGKGG